MARNLRIGVLKESKIPIDVRTPLTPDDAITLEKKYPNVEVYVESSEIRCFNNKEYNEKGIDVLKDISFCDLLLGVKEVNLDKLIPNKTYMFFSHTAKKQQYNKKLLKAILDKNIRIIDYEYLTDDNNKRLIAFGRWAGIIGCYNGIRALGIRHNLFSLPPGYKRGSINAIFEILNGIALPPIKILITGRGRAAHGAAKILDYLNVKRVSATDILELQFAHPVYAMIGIKDYVKRKDGAKFKIKDFINNPEEFISKFNIYTKVTDMLISCHFWDPKSPKLMTLDDMKKEGFKISIIADITCDINGSIPSTIRPSTIENPFYGFIPQKCDEVEPFRDDAITVMAVDNLPCELPNDASKDFSSVLIEKILPLIIEEGYENPIIKKATIAEDGKLTDRFSYLHDYVIEEE